MEDAAENADWRCHRPELPPDCLARAPLAAQPVLCWTAEIGFGPVLAPRVRVPNMSPPR